MKTSPSRRRRTLVALAAIAFAATACGMVDPNGSSGPALRSDAIGASPIAPDSTAAPSDLPMDGASRELVAVMDPGDGADVVVSTTWTPELTRAAAAAGLHSEINEPGASISIDGPIGVVLALLDGVPITQVTVLESQEALRPIPEARPIVQAPKAGLPYLAAGFPGDLTGLVIASPRREILLDALARTVATIDGRPYAVLRLDGGCGSDKIGENCGVDATGFTSGALGGEDDWSVRMAAQNGWVPQLEGALTMSVPRSLIRAAEWIARHDNAALAAIRTYTTCCEPSWDPARPGTVTLTYSRLCAHADVPGRELADTGECRDELPITVDLGSGTVLSIGVAPGG